MKSCNTSPRNKYGAEALSMGAASGHISTVRLLLDAGAKVSGGGGLGGHVSCATANHFSPLE